MYANYIIKFNREQDSPTSQKRCDHSGQHTTVLAHWWWKINKFYYFNYFNNRLQAPNQNFLTIYIEVVDNYLNNLIQLVSWVVKNDCFKISQYNWNDYQKFSFKWGHVNINSRHTERPPPLKKIRDKESLSLILFWGDVSLSDFFGGRQNGVCAQANSESTTLEF